MSAARILVVEDEAVIAEEIQDRLSNLGYEVSGSVRKAEAALQSVETNPPDLVLMDIVLRGKMDGIQAADRIIARHSIPIIYLTAYADKKTINRAKMTGASGYLVKPIREKELHATIEMALQKQERFLQVRENEVLFRNVFDRSSFAMFLIDPEQDKYLEVNLKGCEMLGFTKHELMNRAVSSIHTPADFSSETESLDTFFKSIYEKKRVFTDKLLSQKKVGQAVHGETFAYTVNEGNRPCIIVLQSNDEPLETQRRNSQLAETLFNVAAQAILITDADRKILSVNPAFLSITGYSKEDVIGKTPRILSSGRHERDFYDEMWEAIGTIGHWEGEIWNRKKNGEIYPEWLSIVSVKNKQGEVVYYTGLFSDITKRKLYEERLHFQAYYDLLTRLPNRMLVYERLSQAIVEARRSKAKVALLYIDLDGFKQVNDTYGHIFGDKILKNVAIRLLSCVRESDTVARAGGDEFLIVVHADRREIVLVTEKIIQRISAPFQIDASKVCIGVSIGITIAPDDGEEVSRLLKNSDMAMYKAKRSGHNMFHFFSETMEESSRGRLKMESDLKQALIEQELVIHYQPIIALDSLKTISLEALTRWNHTDRGLLQPDQFIPFAEESGLISKIDAWVIVRACKQVKKWQRHYGSNLSLSVNVSKRLLEYEDFKSAILTALEESELSPEFLTLEIKESLLASRFEEVMSRLLPLKEVGVQIAIDDFGSSYSSLDSLSQLPVNVLKIDRSFVRNLKEEGRKKSLFEALVHVGKSMGMKVIAKGVERHNDLSYLTELHCDGAQGFYFSQPVSSEAYEEILAAK